MSPSRKVLFVSKYYYPHIGGVEKHLDKLNYLLTQSGSFEVTVLTEKFDKTLPTYERLRGVDIVRISYPHIKFLGLFLLWYELIKKLKLFMRADVIHVHDVFIWILLIRILFFWKKMYITFHGWEGKYPIPLNSLLQKRFGFLLTHGNICVGKYLEQLYSVKSTFITYGGTDIKLSYKKFKKIPEIIFIGRLENDTGVSLLVKSLKEQGLKATFYGDGSLNTQCKKVGKVKGFVRNTSKAFKNCDICFAGGYLTTLDSMVSSKITVVLAPDFVRQLAFRNSPFYRRITICSNESQVTKLIENYGLKNDALFNKVNNARIWAARQDWEKLYGTYLNLWNR